MTLFFILSSRTFFHTILGENKAAVFLSGIFSLLGSFFLIKSFLDIEKIGFSFNNFVNENISLIPLINYEFSFNYLSVFFIQNFILIELIMISFFTIEILIYFFRKELTNKFRRRGLFGFINFFIISQLICLFIFHLFGFFIVLILDAIIALKNFLFYII